MNCNLCILTFKLRLLNFVSEFKTFIVIYESPNIWMLLCLASFASWQDFRRANNSTWLFVRCPTPQLKLVPNLPPGKYINPSAPTFPVFPFDAPSKKIETLFFFCHHYENSFSVVLTFQLGLKTVLPEANWILSTSRDPSYLRSASSLMASIWIFPTTSNRRALALSAIIYGFVTLLLKIKSFLANQIFHQTNFRITCHIFLQSKLVERRPRYLDC